MIVFQTITGIFLPVNFSMEPPFLESREASAAANWYGTSGWGYRKKITIDHDKVSGLNQTEQLNFPILVSRTDDDWRHTGSSGKVGQINGEDFLFTSSDGQTKLSHEIEKYTDTTGELIAWVKIPTLSASADTEIYLYYGNAGCVDQQDTANVWDEHFAMVQHLQESSANDVAGHPDSTNNSNHGTPKNFNSISTSTTNGTGKIDGADVFDGADDYVDCGSGSSLDNLGPLTVEAWIYPHSVETGFKIERSTDNIIYTQIGTVSSDITTYTGSGTTSLDSNTQYYFRVRAYNTVGNSSYSTLILK